MASKYPGRGSFVHIPNMGRVEVEPGSQHRVAQILAQYQSQRSVKISYAPNYVGNSMRNIDEPSAQKKSCK